MKENFELNDDLKVEGNIICEDGVWNINCGNIDCRNINCGNLNCWNIHCWNINCWNINCGSIDCGSIDCRSIDCWNINCENINCEDINFYAFAIAYNSFKCKSFKARRSNSIIKCLDGEIEIKEKVGDKCGSVLE